MTAGHTVYIPLPYHRGLKSADRARTQRTGMTVALNIWNYSSHAPLVMHFLGGYSVK